MIGAAEARAWAEAVLRSSVASLRQAHAHLCCPWVDPPEAPEAEQEFNCGACRRPPIEHHAGWVAEFLSGTAGDSSQALRAARRITDALKEHEEMKRFFVAERGSHFVLWCAVLGQNPEAVRRGLRDVLFFPWSPRALRNAMKPTIRARERLKKQKLREKKRASAA